MLPCLLDLRSLMWLRHLDHQLWLECPNGLSCCTASHHMVSHSVAQPELLSSMVISVREEDLQDDPPTVQALYQSERALRLLTSHRSKGFTWLSPHSLCEEVTQRHEDCETRFIGTIYKSL